MQSHVLGKSRGLSMITGASCGATRSLFHLSDPLRLTRVFIVLSADHNPRRLNWLTIRFWSAQMGVRILIIEPAIRNNLILGCFLPIIRVRFIQSGFML